jgi:hypothetical protein
MKLPFYQYTDNTLSSYNETCIYIDLATSILDK